MNGAHTDAAHASNAARQLARARWGNTRAQRLVHELRDRAGQLGPQELAELRLVLAITDEDNDEKDGAA